MVTQVRKKAAFSNWAVDDAFQNGFQYARKFARTLFAYVKGDYRLLVKNNRLVGPTAYFASSVALVVASIKSFWPDDPIKTFENPIWFKHFQPFLEIIPLPLFSTLLIYIGLVNIPTIALMIILRYRIRIDRIIAASLYVTSSTFFIMVLFYIVKVFSYQFIRIDNALYVLGISLMLFLFWRGHRFTARAHGVSSFRLFLLNFFSLVIPLTLIDLLTNVDSSYRIISAIFQPRPIQLFNIPSGSMEPTLPVGSELIVNRTVSASQLIRGDVIVFLLPRDQTTSYVKRIIGMPGDRVQMKKGRLYINGEIIQRELIAKFRTEDLYGHENEVPTYTELLPNGRRHKIIEIQGDDGFNDDTSLFDVPAEHYFVMGDNRDNSTDSRAPSDQGGVGFVPSRNVIGKAYFITYPPNVGYLYKQTNSAGE